MDKIRFGTTIYDGKNSLSRLSEFQDEKVLIVTDEFIAQSGMLEKVMAYFTPSVETMVFSKVVPDPPIDNIVMGLEESKSFHPTLLLAIGGGSAIDAAKAMLYFGQKSHIYETIPFIVIPTTSGTGSEVTNFAIITDAEKELKYPLISEAILPTEAILDVDLVMTLPPTQTADTGIDVLTHAIEAMVSTKATELSDALAEKAIEYVFRYLEKAYKDGSNRQAREKMHIASTMAGLAFNQASLGINHSIAHAAGARFHIAHGRLNGILLPHIIRYNAQDPRAAKVYMKIAKMLGLSASSPQMAIRSLTNAIISLEKRLNMPTSLSKWGLDRQQLESHQADIATDALKDRCTETNPVIPSKEEMIAILKKAY